MTRRDLDAYYTPSFATRELLKYFPVYGKILEPCVGEGNISQILTEHLISKNLKSSLIYTNDIDKSVKAHTYYDASLKTSWDNFYCAEPDFVISNPPFNLSNEIVPLAFEHTKVGVAMLLRASWMEPTFDRQDWLKEHEDYLSDIIFLPRISFTGDGKSDNMSCNFYCWKKEKQNGCKMHWVLKEKRSRAKNKDQRLLTWMKK